MKKARLTEILDWLCDVLATFYIINAALGLIPGIGPEQSLGWACLLLLLIVVRHLPEAT